MMAPASQERGSGVIVHEFSVETFYTAAEIAGTTGGDATTAFPMVAGQTVAFRLRPDIHQDAPGRIHVDAGPVHLHGIEALLASGEVVPLFLRDHRRTLYAYIGLYRAEALDRDREMLKIESERIGRRVLAIITATRVA